jgi:hypothetical protein
MATMIIMEIGLNSAAAPSGEVPPLETILSLKDQVTIRWKVLKGRWCEAVGESGNPK